MLNEWFKKDRRTNLEKEIDEVLKKLEGLRNEGLLSEKNCYDRDGNVKEVSTEIDPCYTELVEQLNKLYKMKEIDKKSGLNPNTILTVGGSVVSIIGILIFEKTDFLSTKALQFVLRGRV